MLRLQFFKRRGALTILGMAGVCLVAATATALAGVSTTGYVDPLDPLSWDIGTHAHVGYTTSEESGNGSVTVNGGSGILSARVYMGEDTGKSGAVTVTGSGSTWENSDVAYVGYFGAGTLLITDHAAVTGKNNHIGTQSGSSGSVTVSGSASWTNTGQIKTGSYGNGSFSINTGGTVTCDSASIATDYVTGAVTVDGPGSTLMTTNQYSGITVGSNGTATLSITNGGRASSAYGTIAEYGGSGAVDIAGENSTWAIASDLFLGMFGIGTVSISNGGAIESGTGPDRWGCGVGLYGSGLVTISGSNSSWTNGSDLWVGGVTTGTVTQTGGLVSNAGTLYLSGWADWGGDSTSHGTYNLTGGTLAIQGGLAKGTGNDAAFNFGAGTLRADAAFSSALSMTLTGDGGDGTVDTNGYEVTLSGNLSGDGGLAKTGSGTLTLSGSNNYTDLTAVSDGVLKLVDATSDWTGAFNPIFAGGSASVGGGSLLFNYGSTYDDATALSNIQSAITAGTIFEAYHTAPLICSGNTATDTVTVMNTLFGDSNIDGSVNGTDLNAVLSYYNQSGQTWANGDFNFDGSVNGTDLNTVLSNYNQSLPASTAAVPEPSTLLLMVLGLVGLLACRKRFGIC